MPKILFTNIQLFNYAGSEINTLYIASCFSRMGWEVEIAVLDAGSPILEKFQALEIPIRKIPEDELSSDHYDLIWSQHSVILDHLIFEKQITASHVIYSSLSPFEPYEAPPVYASELSLILANSPETRSQLLTEGFPDALCQLMPNFVTNTMVKAGAEHIKKGSKLLPEKIAVISNHICEEVYAAIPLLTERGITVDLYGWGHRQVLIDETTLQDYDVVVTIGKTIPYCMASGVCAFCYDHFGGPGYLTEENFQTAEYHNFAGRGFEHKSAEELAEDILNGYSAAQLRREQYHAYAASTCLLDTMVDAVLNRVESRPDTDLDHIRNTYALVRRQNQALIRLIQANTALKIQLTALQASHEELAGEFDSVIHSTIWKASQPLRSLLDKLKGH